MTTVPDGSRLTVLAEEIRLIAGRRRAACLCRCSCGRSKWIRRECVASGSSMSCGCLNAELKKARKTKHGMYGSRAYEAWMAAWQRCTNANNKSYPNYGARGIRVRPGWREFTVFYDYLLTILPAGEADIPKGLTLDRTDNNGNYEPGNIRLVPAVVQQRNTRQNVRVVIDGQSKCLSEWIKELGANGSVVRGRIRRGCDPVTALREAPKSSGGFCV